MVAESNKATLRRWPFRWTAAALATVLLMFVSGIAAVGITHQTAWLVSSPEPITEGGIGAVATRIRSANNLREIVLAKHNYSEFNENRLPAHAIYGARGESLLSWRVLLLPYLEQEDLFNQFKLDEPWDSPHNLRLLPRIPQVYTPPYNKSDAHPAHTFYQVFVGPGAAFEGKTGLVLPADFPDGTANTLLLVEAGESVPWTKPQDIPYGPDRPLPELGGLLGNGFNAARVDGSVRFVPNNGPSEQTIRAAITRNGGEVYDENW
jgi:hypothetical protein